MLKMRNVEERAELRRKEDEIIEDLKTLGLDGLTKLLYTIEEEMEELDADREELMGLRKEKCQVVRAMTSIIEGR